MLGSRWQITPELKRCYRLHNLTIILAPPKPNSDQLLRRRQGYSQQSVVENHEFVAARRTIYRSDKSAWDCNV